jgi:short-subunit dehydrogenase
LENYSLSEHVDMMHLNMLTPFKLIYLFLPQLRDQRKAYIVNIASTASYQAVPGLNLYAACKAFVLSFSRGLRYELRHTNVSVSAVCPGATKTDFINRANIKNARTIRFSAMFNMQPQKVAAIAIRGMYAKKTEMIPGFLNKVNAFFVWLLPKFLSERSAAFIYNV